MTKKIRFRRNYSNESDTAMALNMVNYCVDRTVSNINIDVRANTALLRESYGMSKEDYFRVMDLCKEIEKIYRDYEKGVKKSYPDYREAIR